MAQVCRCHGAYGATNEATGAAKTITGQQNIRLSYLIPTGYKDEYLCYQIVHRVLFSSVIPQDLLSLWTLNCHYEGH
jgi:hypothetical protein